MPDTPKQIVREMRDTLERLESELGSAPADSSLEQSIREAGEVVRKLKQLRDAHRGRAEAAEMKSAQRLPLVRKVDLAPSGGLQKREYVLLALEEIGCPASPALISAFITDVWHAEVRPTQFASIRKGDERAWMRGRRTRPLIVPALNAFDLSPRPRTYAVSTWPGWQRVMGVLSDRADALRIFLAAFDRLEGKNGSAWRRIMSSVAADFRLGGPAKDVATMVQEAHRALSAIADADDRERHNAAERLGRLSERWQVFGRPLSFDVVEGGKHV
jgi:hypothetical protein